MPQVGIHGFASTSCIPATPSWKRVRMVRETTNSISAAARPIALISAAQRRGTSIKRTAVAMGSQRMTERTWLMTVPQGAERRARGAGGVLANDSCGGKTTTCALPPALCALSYKHPYEHHHAGEEHQRVVAHVAGLHESEEVAEGVDRVAEERQRAVDQSVDAAPEERRDPLQRPHHGHVVHLVDVPLVLERPGQAGGHVVVAGELPLLVARAGDPPAEDGDQ